MKRLRTYQWIARISTWIIFSFFFSCENPLFYNKCIECYDYEPEDAEIEVKLSLSTNEYPTILKVYQGKLEDSILVGIYRLKTEVWRWYLKVNKLYTLTATYYMYGAYYTCVDAITLIVNDEKVLCAQPCYFVEDYKLDLRLKHR